MVGGSGFAILPLPWAKVHKQKWAVFPTWTPVLLFSVALHPSSQSGGAICWQRLSLTLFQATKCWHQVNTEAELWLWAIRHYWGLQNLLGISRADQALAVWWGICLIFLVSQDPSEQRYPNTPSDSPSSPRDTPWQRTWQNNTWTIISLFPRTCQVGNCCLQNLPLTPQLVART